MTTEVFQARRPSSVVLALVFGGLALVAILRAFPGSPAWVVAVLAVTAIVAGGVFVILRHRIVVTSNGLEVRYVRRRSIQFGEVLAVRRRTTPGHNDLHYDWVLDGSRGPFILPSMEQFRAADRRRLAALLQERLPAQMSTHAAMEILHDNHPSLGDAARWRDER